MMYRYIVKYKLYIFTWITLNIILWLISIFTPFINGKYIDFLLAHKNINGIYSFTLLILSIYIVNIFISYISNILTTKIQNKITFGLIFDILKHIKLLPLLYFKSINSSYLSQRINSDSNIVASFVLNNFFTLFIKFITFVFSFYMLMSINLKLAFILFLLIPLYLICYFIFKKPLFIHSYNAKEKQSIFFSKMNEQLSNIRFIKLNASFNLIDKQFNHAFLNLYNAAIKYSKISYLFSSFDSILSALSQLILFFYGGIEVLNGNITIGQFTMVSSYFSMLIGCTSYFLNFGKSYQDALASFNRIDDFFKLEPEKNEKQLLNNITSITLKSIAFSYDNQKNIINNYSYTFKKGNIYCLIGENGIGKSTFINLILGLYNEKLHGEILYNSTNIRHLDLYETRRNLIGVTEQEPNLVNDTILKNLIYGLEFIDHNSIETWCNKLKLKKLINKLPDALNTMIYEKSINISGGEKQKLSLARIFIKNPDLMILDEPTSALDFESIHNLKLVLEEIKKDKIIIIITHNNSLLDIADNVIDFNRNKESMNSAISQ